ncbi:MAG TPA: flagellar assembly protein FliX [Pseudorhodoplanes sp.]|jgi:hypothetical protein|nr:flagellar assembly protein FliX [Pseudorhodoplanes sp.]
MRVQGSNAVTVAPAGTAPRRGTAGTFSLDNAAAAQTHVPPASLRTIAGIDALIALQGVGDPTERRRRAAKNGRAALDALDALKLGLISGDIDLPAINRLKAVTADLKGDTGDAGLDAVLAEIDLRVQVELAKLAPR